MRALAELIPLLIAIFFFPARGDLRRFFLLSALITLPFRLDLALGSNGHAGWIDGYVISISDVFFVCFGIQTALDGGMRPLGRNSIARSLVLFASAGVLSMLNSESKPWTLMQVVLIIQVLLVSYVLMARCLKDQGDLEATFLGLSLSLILQGLIACVQFGLQRNFLLFSTGGFGGKMAFVGDDDSESVLRVFGTVASPNGFAMFLGPLLLFNIALLSMKDMLGRKLRMLSVVLGLLGLVLSASRGGWLSFSAGLLSYFAINWCRFKSQRAQLVGGAVLFLVVVSILGGGYIRQRLTSDDKNAAGSRVPLIKIAVEMIKAHPIVGVGANTYHNVMRRYLPNDFEATYVDQVHNTYLLVAAEMGLVGFAAAFLLVRSFFREALLSYRNSDRLLESAIGLGIILVLVQVLTHALVEAYISKLVLTSLFTLAGIITAARRINV